ncbi:hypothetical protein Btru_023542 [Bulinus truncatus]|nr:hypothetical protein Btru_023542 [Bulinus truncatus]
MTFNPNRNPYVNECSIQTHTRRGRVRAWSESTTTSLLSSSDSLTSIRVGAPSISVSAARRPLPEIPAVQSPLVSAQLNIDKASSVQRTCPSKRDRRNRSGSESRRNTLIYLSIASAVFSLFCLSLLAATFFRHGILPWDDVAAQTGALGSCEFCVGLLQASLRCLLVNNGISPSSSSTDEAIRSRVSERISSYPTTCTCLVMQSLHQFNQNYWNVQTGKTDLIIQDNGQYVVSSRSEVQMDLESCTGGKDPKTRLSSTFTAGHSNFGNIKRPLNFASLSQV